MTTLLCLALVLLILIAAILADRDARAGVFNSDAATVRRKRD